MYLMSKIIQYPIYADEQYDASKWFNLTLTVILEMQFVRL